MIGFLRFVGVLNAAVWSGAAFFFSFGVEPGALSSQMNDLLGPRNFPYFSVSITQILAVRYFHLFLVCSLVALLHLGAEWLYLGKYPRKMWIGLVLALWMYGVLQNYWLQPQLKSWHYTRYAQRPQSAQADRAYRAWQIVSETTHLLILGCLTVYLWRVANPSEPARFLSATKFRS